MIAMYLEELLEDAGCVVVGPFSRVAAAVVAAGQEVVDAALLDVNLAGEKVYPAAEILAARGVPFLLLSGYGDKALPRNRLHWRCVDKPVDSVELLATLASLIAVPSRLRL